MKIVVGIAFIMMAFFVVGLAKYRVGTSLPLNAYEKCVETAKDLRSEDDEKNYRRSVCDRLPYEGR